MLLNIEKSGDNNLWASGTDRIYRYVGGNTKNATDITEK